jgi:hypothetical protein
MPSLFVADPPVTDVPTYWFVKLESAIEAGDFEAAAEAQRNLRRLGVIVNYEKLIPRAKAVASA